MIMRDDVDEWGATELAEAIISAQQCQHPRLLRIRSPRGLTAAGRLRLPKGRGPLRRNRAARPNDSRQWNRWSSPTARSGWRRSNLDRRGPDALSERRLKDKLLAGCRPGYPEGREFSPTAASLR